MKELVDLVNEKLGVPGKQPPARSGSYSSDSQRSISTRTDAEDDDNDDED